MTIQDIQESDPGSIKEIVETDSVRTAVLTPAALEKYKANFNTKDSITLRCEGMELRLFGFNELKKRDGSQEASMYFKINSALGQLQYVVSDHDDAEQVRQELYPILVDTANEAGLTIIDVRAVAAESIGSLKRAKGVTDTAELIKILAEEHEQDGETR